VLTGRSPFNLPDEDSTSDQNTIIQRLQRTTQAIKSVTPTLPSLVNGKVPGALDRIAMKLLEKNPADRYATGTELAQALDQALAEADAAWEAPFDVPPPPSPSAPTRGGPARTAAHKSPEILPALAAVPSAST
jgi:serine/threonine-protein kinase